MPPSCHLRLPAYPHPPSPLSYMVPQWGTPYLDCQAGTCSLVHPPRPRPPPAVRVTKASPRPLRPRPCPPPTPRRLHKHSPPSHVRIERERCASVRGLGAMGNTPSAEMPRKLLKSRPPSLALDSPPDVGPSLESQGLSSPGSTRYCNSYLAGSRRTMSYQHLPSPSRDGHSLYRQPSVASISPSAPSSPWRQPEPFDTLVRSHAPAVGPDASGSDIRRRLIRAKSVVYPSDCSLQSLTRTYRSVYTAPRDIPSLLILPSQLPQQSLHTLQSARAAG